MGKLAFFLLHAVVMVFGFRFHVGRQGIKQATFERINNTCAGRKVPMIFTYQGMTCDDGKLIMNCTVKVSEDVLEEPKLIIDLTKCRNKENLDTCEHFYTYTTNKYCTICAADNVLWSPFYNAFEPKFNCPFKKGVYRATNGVMDVNAFLAFPIDASYWRIKIQLINKNDPGKIVMCLFVETHLSKSGA